MLLDVVEDAEVRQREPCGRAQLGRRDRPLPRLEVDVGRRRGREDEPSGCDADAARVAGVQRAVLVQHRDVVARVARCWGSIRARGRRRRPRRCCPPGSGRARPRGGRSCRRRDGVRSTRAARGRRGAARRSPRRAPAATGARARGRRRRRRGRSGCGRGADGGCRRARGRVPRALPSEPGCTASARSRRARGRRRSRRRSSRRCGRSPGGAGRSARAGKAPPGERTRPILRSRDSARSTPSWGYGDMPRPVHMRRATFLRQRAVRGSQGEKANEEHAALHGPVRAGGGHRRRPGCAAGSRRAERSLRRQGRREPARRRQRVRHDVDDAAARDRVRRRPRRRELRPRQRHDGAPAARQDRRRVGHDRGRQPREAHRRGGRRLRHLRRRGRADRRRHKGAARRQPARRRTIRSSTAP